MVRRLATCIVLAPLVAAAFAGPARAQDADVDLSEFVVRLNRLESQNRTLSGQVEQLQFDNRQLKEQLRKFQEDVEFRLNERGGGSRAPAPQAATPAPPASAATPGGAARPGRRGDAFDPSAEPAAPGAPRALGTATPAPSGLNPGRPAPSRDGIAAIIENDAPAGAAPARPPSVAAGTEDARADYDAAYAYVLQRQYDQAEMALRRFVQSHPRDRSVADATYWLGETYLQRSRFREAAEQFLKVSTDHARSAKAPDALLKLGISLAALGARDQACATFAELERKYPAAPAGVKQGVDREQKKARCAA
ncbi:MAG: tol-pal system protein YbgF [Methylobacteriaceae bacterium]|nr:tol-pal system protein YbgF [Methylobacteriaceae bacterium]